MNADRSAAIAHFIMNADCGPDPRDLVFGLWRCFACASYDEMRRGIEIALELHEAAIALEAKVSPSSSG